MEPAVSVRPCLKTHESQTEVHHDSTNSVNVCPVVEEEMDEENLDEKEEQSEESRAVRVGRRKTTTPTLAKREEHERTHIPCVAARASNPAHRGRKFAKAVEDDKDMKQVSYNYCFMRDQPGAESATILVSKDRATRMVSAHVVPPKGAVMDWVIQQCARDLERLGHYGQITSDRGRIEGDREPSWVSWNAVGAPAGCGLAVERVHGIRSVEETTRVILFDLSSRVGESHLRSLAGVSVDC